MIRVFIGLMCLVLAVGAIDGPVGYENDNWSLCFIFMCFGIGFSLWGLSDIAER
jgi:hypothetical protein